MISNSRTEKPTTVIWDLSRKLEVVVDTLGTVRLSHHALADLQTSRN